MIPILIYFSFLLHFNVHLLSNFKQIFKCWQLGRKITELFIAWSFFCSCLPYTTFEKSMAPNGIMGVDLLLTSKEVAFSNVQLETLFTMLKDIRLLTE